MQFRVWAKTAEYYITGLDGFDADKKSKDSRGGHWRYRADYYTEVA